MDSLQERVKTMKADHRKAKDELVRARVCLQLADLFVFRFQIAEFSRDKRQLDEKITRKESELETVRHELNQVKEFQKKKTQMQKELEDVRSVSTLVRFRNALFSPSDQRGNDLERTRTSRHSR